MYFFVGSRTDSVDGAASIWLMYLSRSSVFDLNMVVVPMEDVIENVLALDVGIVDDEHVVLGNDVTVDTIKVGGASVDVVDDILVVVDVSDCPILNCSSFNVCALSVFDVVVVVVVGTADRLCLLDAALCEIGTGNKVTVKRFFMLLNADYERAAKISGANGLSG